MHSQNKTSLLFFFQKKAFRSESVKYKNNLLIGFNDASYILSFICQVNTSARILPPCPYTKYHNAH